MWFRWVENYVNVKVAAAATFEPCKDHKSTRVARLVLSEISGLPKSIKNLRLFKLFWSNLHDLFGKSLATLLVVFWGKWVWHKIGQRQNHKNSNKLQLVFSTKLWKLAFIPSFFNWTQIPFEVLEFWALSPMSGNFSPFARIPKKELMQFNLRFRSVMKDGGRMSSRPTYISNEKQLWVLQWMFSGVDFFADSADSLLLQFLRACKTDKHSLIADKLRVKGREKSVDQSFKFF